VGWISGGDVGEGVSLNIEVGVGDAEGVGEIDRVGLGVGVGVGVGVGSGGTVFTQWCNGAVAPPISFTSASQRTCNFSKSGGPHDESAVPLKTM
jgi:hypothetical protein